LDRIIVEGMVAAARKLGCKIVAEFVSRPEIQEIMIELGIDYSQ